MSLNIPKEAFFETVGVFRKLIVTFNFLTDKNVIDKKMLKISEDVHALNDQNSN